jgi:hypothetical protein
MWLTLQAGIWRYIMQKETAVALFGSVKKLAEAVGYTPNAIYQWPEELDQNRSDMVVGAAIRVLGSGDYHIDGERIVVTILDEH